MEAIYTKQRRSSPPEVLGRSAERCYRKCGIRNAEFGMKKIASWCVEQIHTARGRSSPPEVLGRSSEWCYRKCGIRSAECGIRNEENCFVAYGNNSYQTRSDIARRGSRLDEFFLIFGEYIGNIRFGHDKIHIIKSANGVKIWRADLLRV